MFQVGQILLSNGVQSGPVVFPTPFANTPYPPLVVPVVQNNVDSPAISITAYAHNVSTTGFTYELSALPDSANYILVYLVGSPDVLFSAITSLGRRITQLQTFEGVPADGDRVGAFTQMLPIPKSFALTYARLRSWFTGKLAAIPTSPTSSAGNPLSFAIDGDYLYVKTDTGAARIGLSTTAWAISDKARKIEEGAFQCANGQQVQIITFAGEFPALPNVKFSIRNTQAVPKLVLFGIITGRTQTSVEITLNSPTDSGDYYIDYEASSPQS